MKKFLIWLLIIVLTCGIGSAAYFVIKDVTAPQSDASIETPVDPGGETPVEPGGKDPTDPGGEEPDEPGETWAELLGGWIYDYNPDPNSGYGELDGVDINTMAVIVTEENLILSGGHYDSEADSLVYFDELNLDMGIIVCDIVSYENGLLKAEFMGTDAGLFEFKDGQFTYENTVLQKVETIVAA